MWGFQIYTIACREHPKFKNNIKSDWTFEIFKHPEDVNLSSPRGILTYTLDFHRRNNPHWRQVLNKKKLQLEPTMRGEF